MSSARSSFGAALLVALTGCRDPTEVEVVVTTDVECADHGGTEITAGPVGGVEERAPSASVERCADGTGRVGSLVIVPSGADDDGLAIKVVVGAGGPASACVAPAYGSTCIVARRALRFIPHTKLTIPIAMARACAGVACDVDQTCVRGECVSATLDSERCTSPAGCDEDVLRPGDAGVAGERESGGDAGTDAIGDAPEDVSVDATSDSTGDAPVDAAADGDASDAPAPDSSSEAGDAAPDAPDSGPLSAPRPLSPWNGEFTGSSRGTLNSPLRPRFRWAPVAGANAYNIQIDLTCTTSEFPACSFLVPVIAMATVTPEFTPATSLPVSSIAPRGRRYYWRVQACAVSGTAGCSPWSATRYVDVGRMPNDLDGDGYGELSVGAPYQSGNATSEGVVLTYEGGPGGLPSNPFAISDVTDALGAEFGSAVAMAGDVDADGYAELIAGAPGLFGAFPGEGGAFVYRGSSGSIIGPVWRVLGPSVQPFTFAQHGAAVAGAGDVNGDGFGDIVISAPGQDRIYVYLGPDLSSETLRTGSGGSGARWGASLSLSGDTNGDGYSDLAVGEPATSPGTSGVSLYLGGPGGVSATPSVRIIGPAQADTDFGAAVSVAGDLDGDGYAELVVGAPRFDGATTDNGRVYVYAGGPSGISLTPTRILDPVATQAGTRFGVSLATGLDTSGDGIDDLVVGEEGLVTGNTEGKLVYFLGTDVMTGGGFSAVIDTSITDSTANWGHAVALGDFNGDGAGEIVGGGPFLNGSLADEGGVFWLEGIDLPAALSSTLDDPTAEAGGRFGQALSTF